MPAKPFRPFQKIYYAAALFSVAVLTGTLGYMVIEHYSLLEALYMTVITLSTVGYGEVHHLTDAGRIFTILLIVFDLVIFAYTIALISSYFLEGEFSEEYKLYNMKNSIAALTGHIIICGYGRNGREAARTLRESGRDFVVIERTAQNDDGDAPDTPYYLHNDATRDEALKQAGIEKASALITTLSEDADNVFVVLTARELNPKLRIISRASQQTSVKKLRTAGADNVIMPDKLGGAQMATLIMNPDITEFFDLLSGQSNEQFAIREIDCKRPLSLLALNAWQQTGATILGIKTDTGQFLLNPPPQTQITLGQRLIVMGDSLQIERLKKVIGQH